MRSYSKYVENRHLGYCRLVNTNRQQGTWIPIAISDNYYVTVLVNGKAMMLGALNERYAL